MSESWWHFGNPNYQILTRDVTNVTNKIKKYWSDNKLILNNIALNQIKAQLLNNAVMFALTESVRNNSKHMHKN